MTTGSSTSCPHMKEITSAVVTPISEHCGECDSTSSLRMCLTCGHVGCCESQQGHNTLHAKTSDHPIIRSLPLSANSFTWCYSCNSYVS
jgi:CPA1 family monovalent cation:H+ antiporter